MYKKSGEPTKYLFFLAFAGSWLITDAPSSLGAYSMTDGNVNAACPAGTSWKTDTEGNWITQTSPTSPLISIDELSDNPICSNTCGLASPPAPGRRLKAKTGLSGLFKAIRPVAQAAGGTSSLTRLQKRLERNWGKPLRRIY